uniref:Fork-head domain-containing protein n=1 Tax=Heliothis virescens TaxID=7102 RepID=A0A2A4J402_HELVI
MCEIQDYSVELKDIYNNKYSWCSDMDLYITDSLQDMLDMDIKNEIATDLSSMTDFADTLGSHFSELPPLLDMDTDNSATWLNNSSSFVHNLDLYGSEANAVMVNPNSVMPSTFVETPVKSIVKEEASNLLLTSAAANDDLSNNSISLPSPKEEKSHLTFSPNAIKVSKVQEPEEPKPKKSSELEEATQMVIYVRKHEKNVVKDLLKDLDKSKVSSITTPTTVRIKSQSELIKVNNKSCSILNTSQKVAHTLGTKTIISGNIHILDPQQINNSRTILANGNKNQATILIDNSSLSNNRQIIKTSVNGGFTLDTTHTKFLNATSKTNAGEFPKPAYSYSCLIAMALKNSRTGSLPVSEIYNFMCQHFPYFKTAPNGWKNSVRHNLSLNKCFEKIEKPSTNGSQRKGCLWAMNPSKVGKMDEEVQKWSRKDPQAIKKAMVYPENLEALERGEMKYSGVSGDNDADDDADVDADPELDADVEIDPEVKEEVEEEEAIIEQEVSDQELEVEEIVEGTGMVGGTYRLLATGPSSLTSYITDVESGEEVSDIEILDQSYEEIDFDVTKPVKLDLSMTENYTIHPTKRAKTSFIYQPVTTQTHTSRRKTPLVNRVALM